MDLRCQYKGASSLALAALVIVLGAVPASANDHTTPASPGEATSPAVAKGPFGSPALTVRNITITDSISNNPFQDMDAEWRAVALALGHTATIVPIDFLDEPTNLADTDILIVTSVDIGLTVRQGGTVLEFIQRGGEVYLQGEYLPDYSNNLTFDAIVEALGGSFLQQVTVAGMLEPMNVLGDLAVNPNDVPTITGFWYGLAGSGDAAFEPFLEYEGQHFGWIYRPPTAGAGPVVYTTDQDWILQAEQRPTSVLLMGNILTFLADPGPVATVGARLGDVKSLFR